MRLPSLKQFSENYLKTWAQRVAARYEEDYTAITGAATLGIIATGTTAADAQQLAVAMNQITTTPANSGVRLPDPLGIVLPIWVANFGGATLKVYPPTAAQINALGTDAPFSLGNGKVFVGVFASNLQFYGGALA